MAKVNTDVLEYAAAISADGLELFFTRADLAHLPEGAPRIYRAYREQVDVPFGEPELVSTIEGFVEAPTLSIDGYSLYYHKLERDKFVIYRVTR
jgi:hypothetical protein